MNARKTLSELTVELATAGTDEAAFQVITKLRAELRRIRRRQWRDRLERYSPILATIAWLTGAAFLWIVLGEIATFAGW